MRSPLLPIFLIVSVDVLGLTIILPLLPFYAEHFGASPAVVGLLVSTYAFFQLLSGPILGRISDRIGRRPLLLVSQAGTFFGFLLLAASSQLWMVFLSRIIDGATAGNLSLAQAYIADVTRPEERAKSFALIGIAFGMGFLVGPGISGYLSQFGYQYPILMAAGLSLTSIAGTYFLLPSSAPGHTSGNGEGEAKRFTVLDWRNYMRYFRMPAVAQLLWQFWAFAFTFSTFVAGFALFAERRFTWNGHPFGPKEVGYVFAYVGFLGIILQGGLIGRLVKRFGEARLIQAGFLTAAVGLAALAFTHTVSVLLVTGALAATGTGVLRPAITSLLTQRTPRAEQGTVLGLTQSLNSLSQIVAPFIAGLLIDHQWLAAWALLAAVIATLGLFL
ncbi:MAG TPA: MFS transporter [Bryobacteraceae bacterium]|nr:MFS transporter [Bryobacteraceae bacterium]